MLLQPNPANHCFGCGGANSQGMKLTFEQDDAAQRIRGTFKLGPEYQGGAGFVHGGIVATLLDEVMAKVNRFQRDHAVTAMLNVEYLKPVPVGGEIVVEGWEVERDGRSRVREAEIRNASGTVLARGKARFIEVDRARLQSDIATARQAAENLTAGKS